MPFVNNKGINIFYKVIGQGTPIVMLHGGPGSHHEWLGYANVLKDQYQLILLDLRGNGQSDKPHDIESYTTRKFTSDIIAVLDELKIDKAHCWGYSFGGYMAFCLSRDYPERFHSFIIGGMHPKGKTKETEENLKAGRERLKDGADGLIAFLRDKGSKVSPEDEKKFRVWDFEAINAWSNNEELFSKVDEHLPELEQPFLLYAGEYDEWNPYPYLLEASKTMKNAKTILFKNEGHEVNYKNELILPHVLKFLEENNRK